MSALLVLAALFFVYPTIAGIVYRHLSPPKGPCTKKVPGVSYRTCEGVEGAATWCYRQSAGRWCCPNCVSAVFDEKAARQAAWLWPVAWVVVIARRLFNAGANVTAHPSPDSLSSEDRERLETRP